MVPPRFEGLPQDQEQPLGLTRIVSGPAKPVDKQHLGGDAPLARGDVAVGPGELKAPLIPDGRQTEKENPMAGVDVAKRLGPARLTCG